MAEFSIGDAELMQLLSHVRVVEIANGVAGRYAGRLLADLGADVLRVGTPKADEGELSLLDEYLNCDKRLFEVAESSSFAKDLRRLASDADILLVDDDHSNPVSPLAVLTSVVHARLVIAVCTPYGSDSPLRHLCEDELFFAALSGIASITPEDFDDRADERPLRLFGHQASMLGGLTLAVACLQALRTVRSSGISTVIDFSILDALQSVPIISQAAGFSGEHLPSPPSLRPQTVPRGFLKCADGFVYTQGGDDNWPGWSEVVGRPEWKVAPWSDPAHRKLNWAEADAVIGRWLAEHSCADVYRAGQAHGITIFPVNSIRQVLENPQIIQRNLVVERPLRDGRSIRALRGPIRVSQ